MYNPINAIRNMYHKLTKKEEVRESEEGELAKALRRIEPILNERRRLQAYASTYRCHFANNPGFSS